MAISAPRRSTPSCGCCLTSKPPPALDPGRATDALRELGASLRELGYDGPHIRVRLGRIPDRLTAATVASAERRAGDDELGAAIRCWTLGESVDPRALPTVLPDDRIGELAAAGLLTISDGLVVPAVRITPALGSLVVHDVDRGLPLAADHVIGVGPASRTLAGLTPRHRVGCALDIGSGSGVQALRLASHADDVVATDLSPRAVAATAVSAALAGDLPIETRDGAGLEPVSGETFDLIVSNPPFVVSPSGELTFRDGGQRGDETSRSLVRALPDHLVDGGIAIVLVNWIVRDGDSKTAAAERWLDELPVSALVLHHDTVDPVTYAERWRAVEGAADADTLRRSIDAWVGELEGLEARAIASGAVVMRRADAAPAVRVVAMPKRPRDGGEQVVRMLDAIGRFDGPDDPGLATAGLRLVHGHRIDQRLHYGHGSYDARPARMTLDRSAGVVGTIPADQLEIVLGLDGRSDIDDLARQLAAERGEPAEALITATRATLLELFELGLLEIAD